MFMHVIFRRQQESSAPVQALYKADQVETKTDKIYNENYKNLSNLKAHQCRSTFLLAKTKLGRLECKIILKKTSM